jgi:exopolyphosphatase
MSVRQYLLALFAGALLVAEVSTTAAPWTAEQAVISSLAVPSFEEGVGHFSEWSRKVKKEFLIDWQNSKESEWILVLGNEGGDLDSITAALTWSYHLTHVSENTSEPIKAIALLQTPTDALDLRPENKLALHESQMSSGHRDLLNINELPEDPETLSRKIKGIVLVDHAKPLRRWDNAKILSIFDHHVDVGAGPDAEPRVFEKTASCTTLLARQMLDELEKLEKEYHLSHEFLELILRAIAIDSDGLNPAKSTEADRRVSARVLERSDWRGEDLEDLMEDLDDKIGDARKDLAHLSVRDLLRRDYKSDFYDTPSPRIPLISLGFASIPVSMDEQIERAEFKELFSWFATHAAWTAEAGADVSISLNKYKVKMPGVAKKQKIREIVLVVRDNVRVNDQQADELFRLISATIEKDEKLMAKPWHRVAELGKRQMAWTNFCEDCGRKYVRPLVEQAVMNWK